MTTKKPRRATTRGGRRIGTRPADATSPPEAEVEAATAPGAGAPAPGATSAEPPVVEPGPPSPAALAAATRPQCVIVFDASKSNRQRAVEVTGALGYRLIEASAPDDVIAALAGTTPPDVVVVGLPGGEALVEALRARSVRPVVVLALSGPPALADARCAAVGGDLFVMRPLNRDGFAAAMHAALALRAERQRAQAAQTVEAVLRERLLRYGESDPATGFQHFDFFKKLLVIELKRSRRYGYSLAACLVALEIHGDGAPPAEAARELRNRVAAAIASSIRDIDLPVDVAEDRFLVFLPYTDLDGAERVGRRIAKVVQGSGSLGEGERALTATVSVGIAALRPGQPVSFARLMRDAGAAVRAAQLRGGNQVVVRGQPA